MHPRLSGTGIFIICSVKLLPNSYRWFRHRLLAGRNPAGFWDYPSWGPNAWGLNIIGCMLSYLAWGAIDIVASENPYYLILTPDRIRRKLAGRPEEIIYFNDIDRIGIVRVNDALTGMIGEDRRITFRFHTPKKARVYVSALNQGDHDCTWNLFNFGWAAEDLAHHLENLRSKHTGSPPKPLEYSFLNVYNDGIGID